MHRRVYLAAGMALLEKTAWGKNFGLSFDLWFERAHCEFLNGHLEEAMRFVDFLLQHRLPKIRPGQCSPSESLVVRVQVGKPASDRRRTRLPRLFGMELPAHPTWEQVHAEYDLLDKNMQGRSIQSLSDLPLITDPDIEAIIRMLSALLTPAAQGTILI